MPQLVSDTQSTAHELYDPLFHTPTDDVYGRYAEMRESHPVYYSVRRNVWCLTRFDDVQAAARDWKWLSSRPGGDLDEPGFYGPGNFLDDDPPRHDVLRNVVREFFIPKAIATLKADVDRRVQAIMVDLQERESADLAQDFAVRLPIWVICRLLGAPETDDDLIQRLVIETETKVPGEDSLSERSMRALHDLKEYLTALADEKRRRPDEKVMSRLVAGVDSGAPEADEVVGMAGILFVAGSETTFALLGNLLELLSSHPQARSALGRSASPELIEATIEEALRYESPVQYLARTVTEPRSIHGVTLDRGDRVALIYGAANRDPRRWDQPEDFKIGRERKRHLGFGEGIHHCIGAPLARLEASVALPAFLTTFADYEIQDKRRRDHHIVRGWDRLEATLRRDSTA